MALNVTKIDKQNGENIADACCVGLTQELGYIFRAISQHATSSDDFKLECLCPNRHGKLRWLYVGRLETKARTYWSPPLISCNKIDTNIERCRVDDVICCLALWLDDYPDKIHVKCILETPTDIRWMGHSKRQNDGQLGYAFPRPEFDTMPIYAKRLDSPNSDH